MRAPRLLVVAVSCLAIGAALGIAIAGEAAAAVVGFVGVLIGALIPMVGQRVAASEERRHELSMAALDRRLAAHQSAYALWSKLRRSVHDESKALDVVGECQEWWEENCLYLDASVREAFRVSYMGAANHKDIKASRDRSLIEKNWGDIVRVGQELTKAVELPPIRGVDRDVPKAGDETT